MTWRSSGGISGRLAAVAGRFPPPPLAPLDQIATPIPGGAAEADKQRAAADHPPFFEASRRHGAQKGGLASAQQRVRVRRDRAAVRAGVGDVRRYAYFRRGNCGWHHRFALGSPVMNQELRAIKAGNKPGKFPELPKNSRRTL
jgi:hypothetical protein